MTKEIENKKDMKKSDERVDAHPNVSLLAEIMIREEEIPLTIGGWSLDGFYLKEPYRLIQEQGKGFQEGNTYYIVIKDKKLMSENEQKLRELKEKRENEERDWKKNRIKELRKELKQLEDCDP